MTKKWVMPAALLVALSLAGCFRGPYQQEVSQIIEPSQTAYLVPLEGDASQQQKFDSAAAYEKAKVPSGRIIIPTRWNKTGRLPGSGEWIPTVKVIVVERAPVALHWTEEVTGGTSQKNEGIWLESSDSIAFSIPFAIVGSIEESDASTFLYTYSKNTLSEVLNNEGRNKVMEVVAEYSNSLPLNQLIRQYPAINEKVTQVVTEYYKPRGVTISMVGIAGFAAYRDPAIATAIDGVFAGQQQRAVEEAKSKVAQLNQQVRELEGQAEAARAREESRGPAMAQQVIAEAQRDADALVGTAKAGAITAINEALQQAAQSDVFLENMALDNELLRIERWSGDVPMVMSGENDFVPRNTQEQQ